MAISFVLSLLWLPLSLQLVPGSPFFRGSQYAPISNEDNSNWVNEPLCVLQVGGRCPSGFIFQELRLSVQPDVNPKDKNLHGDDLMHLGVAGDSRLTYDQYDRLYTLSLAFCCQGEK